jgi:hypothetical protein
MEDDVYQALKEAENSLRDFIASVLEKRFGRDWVENCGVSSSRIENWRDRRETEAKRQQTGVVEERLLYYADFYDLSTILRKQWSGEVADALGGKLKTIEVFLDELEKLRDPHAHQRELLPHQKHLVLGLSGEIRNRLVRYRSKMETSEDYYPRLESVRDNLGNVWVASSGVRSCQTQNRLHIGNELVFVVSATDPRGETLSYQVSKFLSKEAEPEWQEDNVLSLTITPQDVRKELTVFVRIRSPRPYHAEGSHDGYVQFMYEVLPLQ